MRLSDDNIILELVLPPNRAEQGSVWSILKQRVFVSDKSSKSH